eukprot:8027758-Pyramimonas_sp.AAC.1
MKSLRDRGGFLHQNEEATGFGASRQTDTASRSTPMRRPSGAQRRTPMRRPSGAQWRPARGCFKSEGKKPLPRP